MVDYYRFPFMRGLHRSFKHLFYAAAYILFVLAIGTMGYCRFEALRPFDALYFSVVTLSTIGYGDFYPVTYAGKAFTLFFIPLGVSAFLYMFGAVSMAIFEGELMEVFNLEKTKADIGRMRDHVIICGYGDVGEQVAAGLKNPVVVENNEERFALLTKKGYLGIRGDSTVGETLREAGIENAKAVIIALNQDPKTVFTVLSIKEMNPQVKIYARANRKENVGKLRTAGADHVVCLPEIGGRELLRELSEG
ncbi:MAG: NAD-binding protein [Candidatus Altiarchaeota archaeon]